MADFVAEVCDCSSEATGSTLDLVAAAFELVGNFGQRQDGSQVNVVQ